MMLHYLRQILTSATCPTLRLRTLTKTWLISLPHVSDTLAAQQPTACTPTMASRSVVLASMRMESLCY